MNGTSRGVAMSLLASITFASFSWFAAEAAPLSGVQVWGWRTLMTVPGILIMLVLMRRWYVFTNEFRRTMDHPIRLLSYAFCAPMLAVQMWLFGWSFQAGRALEMTLGYFLLPLVMVIVGRVLFKERLRPLSVVAAIVAAGAIAHETWAMGGLSWVTALVALGYPAYFVVRRYLQTDGVGALTWELALGIPVAAWVALSGDSPQIAFRSPSAIAILMGLGAISVIATVAYVLAARMLPYGIFGMLSYAEPALVTLIAVVLGERISGDQWVTYLGIWVAVAILGIDGIIALLGSKRPALIAARPWRRYPRHRRTRRERARLALAERRERRRKAAIAIDPAAFELQPSDVER